MSTIEMIFLILMIINFVCNILSFMMLLTLSTEICKIGVHVDFIDIRLKDYRKELFLRKYDQAENEGDQL